MSVDLKHKMRITPRLRFPEFTDEWQINPFGNALESVSSGKSNTFSDGRDYNIYGSTGKIGTSSTYDYEDDHILVARVGANAGYMYRVSGKYKVSDNTLILNLSHRIDTSFTMYVLENFNLNRLVFGSGQPLVTGGLLKKIKIATPGIEEQQKIADFLTTVDKKIESIEQKVELLKQYKKGIMQKIFWQEVRFNVVSHSWQNKKLGSVATIVKGTQINGENLSDIGDYPMLNGGVTPSGFTDSHNTEANTITISEGGNSCGFVGFMTERFWSGGHCYTIQQIDESVDKTFLYHLLKHNQEKIMRLRVGSGLPNIQKKDLSKLEISIPHLSEQQKIADFLSSIDDKIQAEEAKLTSAKKFKKVLLQRMFV